MEVVAPYSPTDKGTGSGFARCNNSLSTSTERQTATRAPLGQALGVRIFPTRAVETACRIWFSVESTVMGVTVVAACWGAQQPARSPRSKSVTASLSAIFYEDLH